MSDISAALAQRRKELNLTKYRVAKQIGINDTTYAEWETGRVKPTKKYWNKIKNVLSIDLFSDEFIPNKLFMMVDTKNYSLPMAVADSANELSEITGYPAKTIREYISRGYEKFIVVHLNEEQ